VQRRRRPSPVHRRIGPGDLRGIGRAGRVLRRLEHRSGAHARQDAHQQPGAGDGELALELVTGCVGANRHHDPLEHRPGVEFEHDAHDGDTGLDSAVHDRPVHRRRAAICR